MGLDDRVIFLALGCFIGFVVGYIVRYLQDIKTELDEVDEIVKRNRDDGGWLSRETAVNLALLLVVIITVWAAFESQANSNRVTDNQDRIETVVFCNYVTLDDTVAALNSRTEFTRARSNANVELQQAQSEFLRILRNNSKSTEAALDDYLAALDSFSKVSAELEKSYDVEPYPTSEQLAKCFEREER